MGNGSCKNNNRSYGDNNGSNRTNERNDNNSIDNSINSNNSSDKNNTTNKWQGDDTYIYHGGDTNPQDRDKMVHVIVPASVRKIQDEAFEKCRFLTTVTCLLSTDEVDSTTGKIISKSSSSSSSSCLREVGSFAFSECFMLRSVVLPPSIEKVGEFAFCYCTLVSFGPFLPTPSSPSVLPFSFPESLQVIEDAAFHGCRSLKGTIKFPKSLRILEEASFYDCIELEHVTFSKDSTELIKIGNGAFGSCTSLKTIELANCIQVIERSCFDGCKQLSSITLPSTLKAIEDLAFCDCTSLRNVDLPPTIKEIGKETFQRSALTSIVFPGSVQTIGDGAFRACTDLVSADLSESSLKSIGDKVFHACRSLTNIRLPFTIERIGAKTFSGCSNLKSISFSSNQIKQQAEQRREQHKLYDNGEHALQLTQIGDRAFKDCITLGKLYVPDVIEHVGYGAFENCPKLLFVLKLPGDDKEIVLVDADSTIQFMCDLNNGGRKFLKRSDDNNNRKKKDKEYLPSLWSLILRRLLNSMEFEIYRIFGDRRKNHNIDDEDEDGDSDSDSDDESYFSNSTSFTNEASIRPWSVVYYLIRHGVAMEYS